MDKSFIITITGPSGVGKNKVSDGILALPDLGLIKLVTCTTRPMRNGEVNGRDYHFVERSEFLQMVQRQEMAEYAEVYGSNLYGSRKVDVQASLDSGKNSIFQLDIQGAHSMKANFRERNVTIFLLPKTIDELLVRLNERATDSPETIERRIAHAEYEISTAGDFDYRVVNAQNKLADTIVEVSDLIRKEISRK